MTSTELMRGMDPAQSVISKYGGAPFYYAITNTGVALSFKCAAVRKSRDHQLDPREKRRCSRLDPRMTFAQR